MGELGNADWLEIYVGRWRQQGHHSALLIASNNMSRLLSAAKRLSRRTTAVRQRLGEDEELAMAGPSAAPAPGDSDWEEDVFEDSDDDSDYILRSQDHDLSDSDEEPDDDIDYVRTLDSSIDSDEPLSDRVFRRAQGNAPGTSAFKWSADPAFVRKFGFEGVYYSNNYYTYLVNIYA